MAFDVKWLWNTAPAIEAYRTAADATSFHQRLVSVGSGYSLICKALLTGFCPVAGYSVPILNSLMSK